MSRAYLVLTPGVYFFAIDRAFLVCGERGVLTPLLKWAASVDEKASCVPWAATKGGARRAVCRLTAAIEITTRSCADTGRAEGQEINNVVVRIPLRSLEV